MLKNQNIEKLRQRPSDSRREVLKILLRSGISSVKGDTAVSHWLISNDLQRPTKIFAAGKAAVSMFEGLPHSWQTSVPTLLVTKTDHIGSATLGDNVEALEAAHPVPNATSLLAGRKALDFIDACTDEDRLLMLISGGSSSLVEVLRGGVSFDELVAQTNAALSEGADISEINRRRKDISAVKGGQLLSNFRGTCVNVLAISDVGGDDIRVIGAGLGAPSPTTDLDYSCHMIASNAVARDAIVKDARRHNFKVILNSETLYGDVAEVASRVASDVMHGPSGLYIYGGEPTVILPENPGKGGRNQALALELARHFQGCSDSVGLVVGTDGTDGPTDAAGAFFDGNTFRSQPDADTALRSANSACFLARAGYQLITGPTGTNVMDLAFILKSDERLTQ